MNSGSQRIRVLLVDDHQIAREGIRVCMGLFPFLEIAGEASSGAEAVRKAKELRPNVVLMDVTLPDMTGLEATKLLKQEYPDAKVLILTVHKNSAYVLGTIECGALGYLLKDAVAEELARAIQTVAAGKTYFSPEVTGTVLDVYFRRGSSPHAPSLGALSQREQQVLALIAKGHSTKEIGHQLNITFRTAETHRERIMRKLGIHNIAGLTRFAIAKGLVELQ